MSLSEAYDFLLNNVGWLHNPEVKLLRDQNGKCPWLKESGSYTTLFAPHNYQEEEYFKQGGKPVVFGEPTINTDIVTVKGFDHKNARIQAIDEIYLNLFKLASSQFLKNDESHRVAGTLLGYSKEAIDFYTIKNREGDNYFFQNGLYYDETNGLSDGVIGVFHEIEKTHLDYALQFYNKIETIYYTGNFNSLQFNKLIKELSCYDLLSDNFSVEKITNQSFGSIDFVMKHRSFLKPVNDFHRKRKKLKQYI
jgi:hypothetical protein